MPKFCFLCGSWRHSQKKCDATDLIKFAYRLNQLAVNWRSTTIYGEGQYYDGRESAIRQCGDDLYEILSEVLDRELPSQQDVGRPRTEAVQDTMGGPERIEHTARINYKAQREPPIFDL